MRKIGVFSIIVLLVIVFAIPCYAGTITTSGVTAETILTRARRDLNEITASYWTDSDLLQWTDEAVREITNKARCLEKTTWTITLSENTWTYNLVSSGGTSYLGVETILYDSGDTTAGTETSEYPTRIWALQRENLAAIAHEKPGRRGPPQVFSVWDDDLFIWPIPGSDQSGTTLRVYAITLPSGVTVSASPIETPEYFDPILLIYIKAKAMFKDERPATGNYYMRLFDAKTKEYINNIIKRAP